MNLLSYIDSSAVHSLIIFFIFRGHDFRTDFLQLGTLKAIFPTVPTMSLTATLSPKDIDTMKKNLGMKNPRIVRVSPNRKNLFIGKGERLPNCVGKEGYDEILAPIALKLKTLRKAYPMTIIYMNMEYLGYAYKLFCKIIPNIYETEISSPTTCLFTQFHSEITPKLNTELLAEIKTNSSNIRVIFATTSLGMGVDASSIKKIIHIRPPATMETFIQEIGRAGRDGKEAFTMLYYNNSDLSSKVISEEMSKFCSSTTCLRAQILGYFGFREELQIRCCSNCDNVDNDEEDDTPIQVKCIKYRSIENIEALRENVTAQVVEWNSKENDYGAEFDLSIVKLIVDRAEFTRDKFEIFAYGVWDEDLCQGIFDLILQNTSD